MSSASPPKEPEVEHENQSGDDPESMDRDNQDPSGHGQGEFEVKEQDRWLPIANGTCCSSPFCAFCCCRVPASRKLVPARFLPDVAGCVWMCLAALWPDRRPIAHFLFHVPC